MNMPPEGLDGILLDRALLYGILLYGILPDSIQMHSLPLGGNLL